MLPSRSSNALQPPPAASGTDAVMWTPYWPGAPYVWLNVWLWPGARLTSASSGPSPQRSLTSRRVKAVLAVTVYRTVSPTRALEPAGRRGKL